VHVKGHAWLGEPTSQGSGDLGREAGSRPIEGRVFPTLETVVREAPAQLRKVMRPDIGIALIDFGQSES